MTHQSLALDMPTSNGAGQQVAQLRQVLALVEQIAGRNPSTAASQVALEEDARVGIAYDHAVPVVQRRFDALVAETALWAAAGVEALIAANGPESQPQAAASRLADELVLALRALSRMLRLSPAAEAPATA